MTHHARYYQDEALESLFEFWARGGNNPLIDMATGTGKSIVIAGLVKRLLKDYPSTRILMLVHVKELVAQNAKALLRAFPQAPIGINSAGLGRRDWRSQVLFASIQSVYKSYPMMGERNLVIVDEAHLIPPDGDGMYRRLFEDLMKSDPDMRVAGFTATPYRTGSGRLDDKSALFDETVYSYGIAQGVADGYLVPLISKATLTGIDVSEVARRGGEFVEGALASAADKDSITEGAADEIVAMGSNRRAWLVFCTGVEHAHHVRDALQRRGVACGCITGETPTGERDSLISAFRAGKLRALTNANVLTTGFDAPICDMIAFLRPTLSTVLYVQMLGRGTRCMGADVQESIEAGKNNCLVLDFAGNVRRHGPVDKIVVRGKNAKTGDDDTLVKVNSIRAKECPDCSTLVGIGLYVCDTCGHEWPKPPEAPKHQATADGEFAVMSDGQFKNPWEPVRSMSANKHVKRWEHDKPPTMRVDYVIGLTTISEYVCFEHPEKSYPRIKAEKWWLSMHGQEPIPKTVDEAIIRLDGGEIAHPSDIVTKTRDKFIDVIGRRFANLEVERAKSVGHVEYEARPSNSRSRGGWDNLDDNIPF